MQLEPSDLYECRFLVFLEDIDEGVFNQVLLNPKQFKRVSDLIASFGRVEQPPDLLPGHTVSETVLSERSIPGDVFNGFESIHFHAS